MSKRQKPSNNLARNIELEKKARKNKKRKLHKNRQEKINSENNKNFGANVVNTIQNLSNNSSKNKDKNNITSYNYGKKGHYSRKCTKFRKKLKN